MKKLLLLTFAAFATVSSYAQQAADPVQTLLDNSISAGELSVNENDFNGGKGTKTTAVGDTLFFHANQEKTNGNWRNINFDFAPPPQPFDSGKLYGINVLNLDGFAQLYRYSSINADATTDTTYRIVGIYTRWHGTVSSSSSQQITMNVWDRGTSQMQANPNNPNIYIYGPPNSVKASVTANATAVAGPSITNNGARVITPLSSPLTGINYDVYVGYTISYTWGSTGTDTFGLRSTENAATNFIHQINGTDSLVNMNNLVRQSGNWISPRFTLGVTNGGDQVILPVIQRECPTCFPTSVAGFNNQSLTFHGNYPNPAVDYTNIIFSLSEGADVTIEVMDMTGRVISTYNELGNKGENSVRINTSNLPAGNYVYSVESSKGGIIASQLTVSK